MTILCGQAIPPGLFVLPYGRFGGQRPPPRALRQVALPRSRPFGGQLPLPRRAVPQLAVGVYGGAVSDDDEAPVIFAQADPYQQGLQPAIRAPWHWIYFGTSQLG